VESEMGKAAIVVIPMLLCGLTAAVTAAETEDPFVRCAKKALKGHYGPLKPWQRKAYKQGLKGAIRRVKVWQTTYYPQEGFDRGEACRWGYGCDESIAAANLLPAHSIVWVPRPGQLRIIGDTGARRNDRVAKRKGAHIWGDLWVPYPGWRRIPASCITTWWVITS